MIMAQEQVVLKGQVQLAEMATFISQAAKDAGHPPIRIDMHDARGEVSRLSDH